MGARRIQGGFSRKVSAKDFGGIFGLSTRGRRVPCRVRPRLGADDSANSRLRPCSAMYSIALSICRFDPLTFPRCTGNRDAIRSYRASVISIPE